MAACAALARASGAEVAALRLLLPYAGWLLLAPAVALFARRWPLERAHLLRHAVAAVVATALLQLTFRSLHWLATGVLELPPLRPGYAFTVLWITLLLYGSTAGTVTALRRLAAAHEREIEAVRSEAAALVEAADRAVSGLGPHALDELLERVRRLAADAGEREGRERTEAAVDALGRYLRLGLEGFERGAWTLRRELELAGAYLDFENACRRSAVALRVAVGPGRLDEAARQHELVEAVGATLAAGAGALVVHEAGAGSLAVAAADAPPAGPGGPP